jgi:hypothetical protein
MTRIGLLQTSISDKPISATCFFNCSQGMVKNTKKTQKSSKENQAKKT